MRANTFEGRLQGRSILPAVLAQAAKLDRLAFSRNAARLLALELFRGEKAPMPSRINR